MKTLDEIYRFSIIIFKFIKFNTFANIIFC